MGKRVLVVVDMQKDFVDGSLGSKEAVSIVPAVVKKARDFDGTVLFTRDTHGEDYMETQEGKYLPVAHCIRGTDGWELIPELEELKDSRKVQCFDKPAFGSVALAEALRAMYEAGELEAVELVGLCTDICVVSNALLIKAFMPELPVSVDASCCAGVTPESHLQALEAMKVCQIHIENDPADSSILSDAHASGETL